MTPRSLHSVCAVEKGPGHKMVCHMHNMLQLRLHVLDNHAREAMAICRAGEKLAIALGTPLDLPSRMASAINHALFEAASNSGHTYMLWRDLQDHSLRLVQKSGKHDMCPVLQPPALCVPCALYAALCALHSKLPTTVAACDWQTLIHRSFCS